MANRCGHGRRTCTKKQEGNQRALAIARTAIHRGADRRSIATGRQGAGKCRGNTREMGTSIATGPHLTVALTPRCRCHRPLDQTTTAVFHRHRQSTLPTDCAFGHTPPERRGATDTRMNPCRPHAAAALVQSVLPPRRPRRTFWRSGPVFLSLAIHNGSAQHPA